jgi:hypothetical protein
MVYSEGVIHWLNYIYDNLFFSTKFVLFMLSNYMFSSFHFGVMMFATISAYKNNAENSSRLPFVL